MPRWGQHFEYGAKKLRAGRKLQLTHERKSHPEPGQKLIILMLSDLIEHLKVKTDTDTKLVREAIHSGNLWALEWGMPGVFHGHETSTAVVDEAANVLVMWERLEQSYENLSKADKESLAANDDLSFHGDKVRFPGFDGNNESEHLSAANFLINVLDRFEHFKGRDLNAHMQTIQVYRRMYKVFDPILMEVSNQYFSAAQLAQVFAARFAPQN
jgi:uncharacterized protein